MSKILITSICLMMSLHLMSQHNILGRILDEKGENLIGATVVLLSATDSTMVAFNITNVDGQFKLEGLEPSEYILQFSFVSYNNIEQVLKSNWESKNIDCGTYSMIPSSGLLPEVTIKAEHIPMGIRGDTISYNTAAFKTRPGASVQDLLKTLPGIEVDRNGNIKAQGEDVQKVLVDGKSFFGDDPKIATQNLEAEAVDKVEVFDKASEIAEFTGIDDGEEQKTINLKLKEDYKNGGFGKLHLEGGSDERHKAKINYNRFSPSMQAAVIGASNNINEQAFTINDYVSFMGGLSKAISSPSGILNLGNQFSANQMAPEGLHRSTSGGINFNYDFSEKLKWISNYFLTDTRSTINRTSTGQQFVNDIEYNSIDTSNIEEKNAAHRINTKLEYHINPLTQIVIKNNFSYAGVEKSDLGISDFFNMLQESSSQQKYDLDQNQWALESELQFRRKFAKKGRNWISNIGINTGRVQEENQVNTNFIFDTNQNAINQFQNYTKKEEAYNFKTKFTEPIAAKRYLSAQYQFGYSQEEPEKLFFDQVQNSKQFNEELSSAFEKQFYYHRAGIALRNNDRKVKINVGVDIQKSFLTSQILGTKDAIRNDYQHLLPLANLEYQVNNSKQFTLKYTTSIAAPSTNQLIPIQDNSDPNTLFLGNPNLNPEYHHNVSFGFNSFDQFNFTNFFSNLSFNYISNRIINEVSVNNDFTREIVPINSDRFISAGSYLSYGKPIRQLEIKFRLTNQIQISQYETFLNDIKSQVNENNISGRLSFDNRKKKYFDVETGIRLVYTQRKYDNNPDFNQNFFNYDLYIENDIFFPENITLGFSYDYRRYSNESFSSDEAYSLLNVNVRKDFIDGRLAIELRAYDLLRQNIGLRRIGGVNSLTEIRHNTLTRYFTVGLQWQLGKIKKTAIGFE